jgi:hypothetical protein
MNMNFIASIVGYLVIIVILGIAAALAIGYAFRVFSTWHAELVSKGVSNHLRRRADNMRQQRHWFQTAEQRAMWSACAEAMASANYPDPRDIRDRQLPDLLAKELEWSNKP